VKTTFAWLLSTDMQESIVKKNGSMNISKENMNLPPPPPPPTSPSKRSNKLWIIIGVVGLLLVLVIAGTYALSANNQSQNNNTNPTATPQPTATSNPTATPIVTTQPTASPTPTPQPTASPTPSPTSQQKTISISSVNVQWNGQTYSVIPTPHNAFTFPENYGAIISFAYTNNGNGFSPTNMFSITSLTNGFTVQEVDYYAQYPQNSGYSPSVPPSNAPIASYQPWAPSLTLGTNWSENGPYVGGTFGATAQASIMKGCTLYICVLVTFPNTSYNGVLTLLASES